MRSTKHRTPDVLLLGEEGGDEGLRLGALGGAGARVQGVLRLDAPHDGVHRFPLLAVLQLRGAHCIQCGQGLSHVVLWYEGNKGS